jgi:hypothetical protein
MNVLTPMNRDLAQDRNTASVVPLPRTTPPTDDGHTMCDWCGRAIYIPAVPCSVSPVHGLAGMDATPGLGDRCKWELATRGVSDLGR